MVQLFPLNHEVVYLASILSPQTLNQKCGPWLGSNQWAVCKFLAGPRQGGFPPEATISGAKIFKIDLCPATMSWNRQILFVNNPLGQIHSFFPFSPREPVAMPEAAMEVQPEDVDPEAVIPPQGELDNSGNTHSGDSEDSGDESPMEEEDAKEKEDGEPKKLYPEVKMSLIEEALEVI